MNPPARALALLASLSLAAVACGDDGGSGGGGGSTTTGLATSTSTGAKSATTVSGSATSTGASSSTGGPFMTSPTLDAIAPNGALDLGAYVCDQPTDNPGGCGAITDYGKLVYDAAAHQLLMWGGGHAGNYASNVVRFDFDALTWLAVSPSTTCANQVADNFDPVTASWKDTGAPTARHTWDMMSIAEVNGARAVVILTSGGIGGYESCNPAGAEPPVPASGKLMSYAIEGGAWSFSPTAADEHWYYASSQETDPVSGKILVFSTAPAFHFYDPSADTITDLVTDFGDVTSDDIGYSNNLVYFPPTDRFYYFSRGTPVGVLEIAVDRAAGTATVVRVDAADAPENPEETGWAYDPGKQVIGGGVIDGKLFAFDPATRAFTTHTMDVTSGDMRIPRVAFHALDFDPVNGVYLFVSPDRRTWAYRAP